ncbi:unnamed protein product [Spirodela intermedia]|uniref:Uncharacterized protein n=1 Tax=Spirodela intermedia TaxID=51605 RepID=A0A7I8JDL4_SPIIN|nr:unnamed protein product [Spirodela intermedia]CAA6668260.1 unnamed protein product [Spirodela intermedia]
MAAGAVRILLECDRQRPYYQSSMKKKRTMMMGMWPFSPAAPPPSTSLWEEPVWSMFCNGRRSGFAVMYMRAKFERVVESSDSEALYMVNPDGGRAGGGRSGPELSIFLLRL